MSNRKHWLKKRYGLSVEQFNELWSTQDGLCAICKNDEIMDIDHCHDTNQVRGLLCRRCNLLIGHARNDRTILDSASSYLQEAEEARRRELAARDARSAFD